MHRVRPAYLNARLEIAGCSGIPAFFDVAALRDLKSIEVFGEYFNGLVPVDAVWRCVRV